MAESIGKDLDEKLDDMLGWFSGLNPFDFGSAARKFA